MKQNVSPWLIASIVIVLVVLIGFVAKRTLFQDPDASTVPWEQTRAYKEQQRMRTQGASQMAPSAANPGSQQSSAHPQGTLSGGP